MATTEGPRDPYTTEGRSTGPRISAPRPSMITKLRRFLSGAGVPLFTTAVALIVSVGTLPGTGGHVGLTAPAFFFRPQFWIAGGVGLGMLYRWSRTGVAPTTDVLIELFAYGVGLIGGVELIKDGLDVDLNGTVHPLELVAGGGALMYVAALGVFRILTRPPEAHEHAQTKPLLATKPLPVALVDEPNKEKVP